MQHLQKLLAVLVLMSCTFCSAQSAEYRKFYNDVAPKLRTMAEYKKQYYGKEFSEFYKELGKKNLKVLSHSTSSISDGPYRGENIILNLYFTDYDTQSYAYHNKYAEPSISILLFEEISPEIQKLGRKYRGVWNDEVYQLVRNKKIREIEFLDLEGVNNPYVEPR